jgi:indolepyruvate ferredoxin oxidoreductase alpha subunit
MKHVGMNIASDALMTLTLTGVIGGLVIAIADDVGLSSSQNEQDARFWAASRTCRCSSRPTPRKPTR